GVRPWRFIVVVFAGRSFFREGFRGSVGEVEVRKGVRRGIRGASPLFAQFVDDRTDRNLDDFVFAVFSVLVLDAAFFAGFGLDLADVLEISEPIEVVAGPEDHAAATPAVAAVRPAL